MGTEAGPGQRQKQGVKRVHQTALTLASAAVVGTVFLKRYPFPEDDAVTRLILHHKPYLFHALHWGWTALLFSTPALAFSGIFSLLFIFTGREGRPRRSKLPPYPAAK